MMRQYDLFTSPTGKSGYPFFLDSPGKKLATENTRVNGHDRVTRLFGQRQKFKHEAGNCGHWISLHIWRSVLDSAVFLHHFPGK